MKNEMNIYPINPNNRNGDFIVYDPYKKTELFTGTLKECENYVLDNGYEFSPFAQLETESYS